MAKKESFFKKKSVTSTFAILALTGGFLFLNQGITGNVVLDTHYEFSWVGLIGLLLVFCSAILALHTVKRK